MSGDIKQQVRTFFNAMGQTWSEKTRPARGLSKASRTEDLVVYEVMVVLPSGPRVFTAYHDNEQELFWSALQCVWAELQGILGLSEAQKIHLRLIGVLLSQRGGVSGRLLQSAP